MAKVLVMYCAVQPGEFHKPTNLWVRSPKDELLLEFVDPEGHMKFICSEAKPEACFGQHRRVRPEAGEAGRKDRGSGACLFVPQGRRITLRLRCCSLSAAPLVLLPPPLRAVYPKSLVERMVSAATRALKHIRRENVDAAFSQDGNANECEVCDNRTVGGEVHLCSKCPRVFHFKCIPPGRRKPQKGTHEAWWCRDPNCPSALM
jgi:hypothetical protein